MLARRSSTHAIWYVFICSPSAKEHSGPPVPCLFVLMELANGGNLEEYVLQRSASEMKRKEEETRPPRRKRLDSASASTSEQLAAEQGSGLSVHEIWNFFLDICSGLEHLHKHGIIHRGK